MTETCTTPLADDELVDYWTQAVAPGDAERIEEHLFACRSCSARLGGLASLSGGVAELVRRGRIAGAVSRTLLNRIQREGVHVRLFSLAPGERIPCAAFPDDDLLVLALRANFAGSTSVAVSLRGPDDTEIAGAPDVPVAPADNELLWVSTGESIRRLPSMRLRLTITSCAPDRVVLGEYELDHSALPPA